MHDAAAQLAFGFAAARALSTQRLARTADPETSHIAAARTVEFRTNHAGRILAALQDHGAMTVCEIERVTGIPQHAIGKRMGELQRVRVAAPTGETRLSASGRPERVWGAV